VRTIFNVEPLNKRASNPPVKAMSEFNPPKKSTSGQDIVFAFPKTRVPGPFLL
jgi:hypothetical protein